MNLKDLDIGTVIFEENQNWKVIRHFKETKDGVSGKNLFIELTPDDTPRLQPED